MNKNEGDENLKIILNALDAVYPLLSQEDKENFIQNSDHIRIQKIHKRRRLNFF